jgi:hypothetical protein
LAQILYDINVANVDICTQTDILNVCQRYEDWATILRKRIDEKLLFRQRDRSNTLMGSRDKRIVITFMGILTSQTIGCFPKRTSETVRSEFLSRLGFFETNLYSAQEGYL